MVYGKELNRMTGSWWISVTILVTILKTYSCQGGSYMVLLPTNFRPCVDYTFTARTLGSLSYQLTATLEDGSSPPKVLATNGPITIKSTRKITLQPPCQLSYGTYYIRVVGSGGIKFESKKRVYLSSKNKEIIIQTDKSLYKPGQTVKYRVFAVKPNLQAVNGEFEITVKDPRNNKIQVKKSKGDSYGVVENELILSTEPIFGTWTIKAVIEGSEYTKTVSVEKYVLPTAEAKVILPSVVSLKDPLITVKAKAEYTFGKPVQGSARLVCRVDYYSTRKWVQDPITGKYGYVDTKQPEIIHDIQLNKNGEASVDITLAELKEIAYYKSLSHKTIVCQVNVTDAETDALYISKESKIRIYPNREKLSLALNPSNYKPGLINTFYFDLKLQNDQPIAKPSTITVTARVKYEKPKPTTTTTTTTTTTASPKEPSIEPLIEPLVAYRGFPYPGPQCDVPSYEWKDLPVKTLTVEANGLARYDLLVENTEALDVTLTATYDGNKDVSLRKTLSVTRSPSNTFLSITLKTTRPTANQNAHFDITSTNPFNKFHYTALSRGSVVASGSKSYSTSQKKQTFVLPLSNQMAPKLRIIAHIIVGKDEIVADSISFNIDGVFKNKVSLSFSADTVKPGDTASLLVKANQYSNVYAVAVDKSTTLLGAETDDHSSDVQEFLTQLDNGVTPWFGGGGFRGGPLGGPMVAFRKKRAAEDRQKREARKLSRQKRLSIWRPYPYFTSGVDAEEMFRNTGLLVITDALVFNYKAPQPCYAYPRFKTMRFRGAGGPMMFMSVNDSPPAPAAPSQQSASNFEDNISVRKIFPETWIWESQNAGANGLANFTLTVPDTITSWKASAFAISRSAAVGVGMTSDIATLTVFKDFFVSLNLPYSVIRGEEIILQVTVFNYLKADTEVEVVLENIKGYVVVKVDAAGFEYEATDNQVQTIKVPRDGTASAFYTVRCVEVGDLDIQVYGKTMTLQAGDRLVRQLKVEPEGIPQEYTKVVLVDLSEKSQFVSSVPIKYPANVVPDSQRSIITAYGDPLGSAINNLDRLIRMPGGCGEQNMLSFVPNIYARRYLKATYQLTTQLADKTQRFLEKGYINQLRYKRMDKSFSAFGDRDESGSQWLTAYVLRTFSEAAEYIFIDSNILNDAARYIIGNQLPDGSFNEPGRVIHKELRGSSFQGVGLTAFSLSALLEVEDKTVTTAAIKSATDNLAKAVPTMTNIYDLAITAYVLSKAKNEFADQALQKLEALKTEKDGLVYWNVVIDKDRVKYYWNPPHKQSSAINIETTAYALLAYAVRGDKIKGIAVMSWLISQQNGNGGYSSSQDTVVALHAISEMAKLLFVNDWNIKLCIFACRQKKTWRITKETATIQNKWVTDVTTESIDVKAYGKGRAVVMVTAKYNVDDLQVEASWGLRVPVVSDTKKELVIEPCVEWRVKGGTSGMAIMEVGLLSGYKVNESLLKLNPIIARVEKGNKKVTLYFDEIGNTPVCIKIKLEKVDIVGKVKPAYVKITDYYNPENTKTLPYTSSLAENTSVCGLCPKGVCGDCVVGKKR